MTKSNIEKILNIECLDFQGLKSDDFLSLTFFFFEENTAIRIPKKISKSNIHRMVYYEVGFSSQAIRKMI
jgi:hypothetical protein